MSQILLGKDQTLPNGLSFDGNTLVFAKRKVFEDTVTIKLIERTVTNLNVVVEESTQVKLILDIEDHLTEPSNYQINLETKENSNVKFLFIADIHNAHSDVSFMSKTLSDSNLEFVGGFISDKVDVKLHLDLNGKGANLKLRTIAVSSLNHEQNLDVRMVHYAPMTIAEMLNIGIAGENGIVRINGVGQIEQGMKQASDFQTLKGIITNDAAQIDVNPILIIDEFDVKAGHAATVGKLEEDVLYYLRSRGLSLAEAQKLIINGYLQPVIDEIDDEQIKNQVITLVNERI
ncbi:SufD family Fe-S cluster assembly protein [Acholeplasma equirhinis]|uniref:SufD family Fe-S cluster assembly protein n=1 Tax=Acholeplasma equirhinis TaxID=555393 RepID=UPI00197A7902|nr:SufD family Fe-S cluster assembly protein [Acholeplasma equirhinis]MBN3491150.1 SufD family Fe-S cluster assembly protein [Acholeplasma equirhinis]